MPESSQGFTFCRASSRCCRDGGVSQPTFVRHLQTSRGNNIALQESNRGSETE
jgi:hypothetical protein